MPLVACILTLELTVGTWLCSVGKMWITQEKEKGGEGEAALRGSVLKMRKALEESSYKRCKINFSPTRDMLVLKTNTC